MMDGSIYEVESYNQLTDFMFDEDLMLFTSSLAIGFRWLAEAVNDTNTTVTCSKNGNATAIRVKRKHTVWISTFKPWSLEPCMESLFLLSSFFDYMECGTRPTPSSIGRTFMYKVWTDHHLRSYSTMDSFSQSFLSERIVGGRADTPGLGMCYRKALYIDMASAYLKYFAEPKPYGAAMLFRHGSVRNYKRWFANCTVDIHSDLPLGPFPIRLNNGALQYPSSVGIYECSLWDYQVEDCSSAGCSVKVHNGIGWTKLTNDTKYWGTAAYHKKWYASNDEIKSLVKLAIVSSIGAHGSDGRYYNLVGENKYVRGDIPLSEYHNGRTSIYSWFVHEICTPNNSTMLHWYFDTVSQCNRELYRFALPFAERGELILTNYDGVIVIPSNSARAKYLKNVKGAYAWIDAGRWTYEELNHLEIIKSRNWNSDEYSPHPGCQKKA